MRRKKEHATDNRQHVTHSMHPFNNTANKRQQTPCQMQHAACNLEFAPCSRLLPGRSGSNRLGPHRNDRWGNPVEAHRRLGRGAQEAAASAASIGSCNCAPCSVIPPTIPRQLTLLRTRTHAHTRAHTHTHACTHALAHAHVRSHWLMRISPSHVTQPQQGWGSSLPHLCTGKGLTPALGKGSLLPHLHRNWAHPIPHLHQDWAHRMPHLDQD
jgi:hypothetical protein